MLQLRQPWSTAIINSGFSSDVYIIKKSAQHGTAQAATSDRREGARFPETKLKYQLRREFCPERDRRRLDCPLLPDLVEVCKRVRMKYKCAYERQRF